MPPPKKKAQLDNRVSGRRQNGTNTTGAPLDARGWVALDDSEEQLGSAMRSFPAGAARLRGRHVAAPNAS